MYESTDMVYPLQLSGNFSGFLPVVTPGYIKKISIFFGTYNKICQGRLRITLSFKDSKIFYDVDMRDITDNSPFTLKINKKWFVENEIKIDIETEYHSDTLLALWLNNKGFFVSVIEGEKIEKFSLKTSPLISVILPVYNCPLSAFKDCFQSVKKQKYKNWELCIVDDASTDKNLKYYIERIRSDKRVKVYFSKKNEGIAKASNKALKLASGKLSCFLDNDDMLDPQALLELARAFDSSKEVGLIYTDEDKISEGGKRFDPFYKPDWNYTMLLSQNYICHLSAYRTDILKKIGGFREGYDGSQDYDLLLRYFEEMSRGVAPKKVVHIPKVLYHWRTTRGSTSAGIGYKTSARVNGERAIAEHLKREAVESTVSMGFCPGTYRVDLTIRKQRKIGIIIPFKDKIPYLKSLLYTVRRSTYKNYEILLVNNGSSRASLRELEKECGPVWVETYNKDFSFSAINNYAVTLFKNTKLYLFLNNDTEVMNSDWLEQMAQHFIRPEVGAVGAKLLYPDHRIQHAGVIIGMGGIAGHSHKYLPENTFGYFARPHLIQEISAVTGACLMTTAEDFQRVGGFEEALPKAFNDVDYCLKLREAGRKIIYTPYARLLHYESLSRGLDNHIDNDFRCAVDFMEKKWGCSKYQDPYYNPNLSLERENFSYRAIG